MGLVDRLGPDLLDPQVDEVHRDQHGRLDRGAHADDGGGEVLGPELLERLEVGGVGFHHVGQGVGVPLDESVVAFDREDLPALADELGGEGDAEPAQADDEDWGLATGAISQ